MTKFVKRLSAAVMAGVMAMSLAMSASAMTSNEAVSSEEISSVITPSASTTATCRHSELYKVRTGSLGTKSLTHSIYVVVNNEGLTQSCSYNSTEFTLAYACKSCRQIVVSSAGTETYQQHFNSNCSLYNNGGGVTVP